jgi:REP element-mobilizing transposase RayT
LDYIDPSDSEQAKQYIIGIIMSNHIHLIVQSSDGKLSDLIRDFKKFIATKILEKIQIEPDPSDSELAKQSRRET